MLRSQDATIIELVDNIIQQALEKAASDIHIEPYAQYCRVRYRCDGLLLTASTFNIETFNQVVIRIKILANMNIAERRLQQDGHMRLHDQKNIDVRVCTCPTLFGEKIVLRLFHNEDLNLDLHHIGLEPSQLEIFLTTLSQPQGLILITGPTGSGKTSTLYAALKHLNQTERNIISIEDPVEIQLEGINQINVNTRIGLDFASALRSFLRQDPDVILVGEIRDRETATIALQAAQTGHLVLTSLHANHACDSLLRLHSLGIKSPQLLSAVSLIIAQRLLRKLCVQCTSLESRDTSSRDEIKECHHCIQGYKGRIGIFELLDADQIQNAITKSSISITPHPSDHLSLQTVAWRKIKSGVCNAQEIARVLGTAWNKTKT